MAQNKKPNDSDAKKSFKDTLNLPQTDFPIRSNPMVDDPALIKRWEQEDLFHASFTHNEGNIKFIFHDGPPYANGHIHLGSAYNKILKDITCKSQRMSGKQVPVTPGWDCHGLPIELKVTQEFPGLSPVALKKECRAYAQKWVDIQREEFKQLGVLMDWKHPYLTMNPGYESKILYALADFVDKGFINKKSKTVPWCPSCQTVLASAEIEYAERKDPSIYVLFSLNEKTKQKLFSEIVDKPISFLIWTTTPWTLPLNRAVLLKPDADYDVLQIDGQYVIVGSALSDKICELLGISKKVYKQIKANYFKDIRVRHPFVEGLEVPIIFDQSVSLQDGTACVHCAPGCGPEDYEVAVKHNLEVYSPITPDGKYSKFIEPHELEGMSVQDGQGWVINKLKEKDLLLLKQSIKHSYPHCWRCRGGLIFRATRQWFLNLSHENLREKALKAIESITFLPERSKNFLKATIQGRLEWCLSRQRVWGVPIPALLCKECDYPFINAELIEKVAKQVAQHGIEYWDEVPIEQLMPSDLVCPQCHGNEFVKEKDILDVWFDSGVSHYAVLFKNPALGFPADLYIEGIDQHRGWFQSSLLTSLILEGEPSTKAILTHGFTVDEKGHKMSKSLGNVVTPGEIIEKIGTDGLRLWVSSIDYRGDAIVSKVLLQNVTEVFRKIRNTSRFLLSNLYDFDPETERLPLSEMLLIDRFALEYLYHVNVKIRAAYEECDFTAVFHELADYCAKELSSFYLDIIKDRLYVEKADGKARRSAQTACWYILDTLTRLMAPILSFAAEYISDNYQKNKMQSIHLQSFNDLQDIWKMIAQMADLDPDYIDWYPFKGRALQASEKIKQLAFHEERTKQWELLQAIRSAVLKSLESLREKGTIKHSLEAKVMMYLDLPEKESQWFNDFFKDIEKTQQTKENFFKEFFIVSQCELIDSPKNLTKSSELKGLWLNVTHAEGVKCPRCWQWDTTVHPDALCKRCQEVLK
ncbi:MAG: isoleucine--tRNA ligase [Candidatus Babeliales bacterium]